MERHFEHDLEELKQRLLWMGSLAERAVHQAVHAVLDADEQSRGSGSRRRRRDQRDADRDRRARSAPARLAGAHGRRSALSAGRFAHQRRSGAHRRSGREHRAIRDARDAPSAGEALRGFAANERACRRHGARQPERRGPRRSGTGAAAFCSATIKWTACAIRSSANCSPT